MALLHLNDYVDCYSPSYILWILEWPQDRKLQMPVEHASGLICNAIDMYYLIISKYQPVGSGVPSRHNKLVLGNRTGNVNRFAQMELNGGC